MKIFPSGFTVLLLGAALVGCDFFDRTTHRIERDQRAMAHVYADSLYDLYYGYGYSIAQDRLFQLDSTVRTVFGQAAESFGPQYLTTDQLVRQLTDYASIDQQIAVLSEQESEVWQMLEGMAAGIDAYVAWCLTKPAERLPSEYAHFQMQPRRWQARDLVMLYVGTMAYRYADFNEELDNLNFLRALEQQHGVDRAWQIFNAALPTYVSGSVTTISSADRSPSEAIDVAPPRPDYLDNLLSAEWLTPLYDQHGHPMVDWRDRLARQRAEQEGRHWALSRESASNLWMLRGSRLTDAEAVLVNGPQFGFANPSFVYGVALHSEKFQVIGNSLYGYPNLLFAHNGRIGWGSTAGFGDQVDIFQLTLDPEKPDHYYYDGQWRRLETRDSVIAVKGAESIDFRSYWTVIGPVVARAENQSSKVIFVRRRGWQDRSVHSLIQWLKLPMAQSVEQFTDILSSFSLSINFYYIDTDGRLGYIHGGHYPERAAGHDNRLPVAIKPDDQVDLNWRGLADFSVNPQHFDPSADYMVNWNNRPSVDWPNSDLWWVKWSLTDRANILDAAIRDSQPMTVEQVWGLIEHSSYHDLHYLSLRDGQDGALTDSSHRLAADFSAVLKKWDRRWADSDADGYYDSPACTFMHQWLQVLLTDVFADDISAQYLARFTASNYPLGDIGPAISDSLGVGIVVRILQDGADAVGYDFFNGQPPKQVLLRSINKTLDKLQAEFGDQPLEQWLLVNPGWRYKPVNFRGVPTGLKLLSGPQAQMNRGSENNMFVVKDGRMHGFDVVPPAQNAYQTDQLDSFLNFTRHPLSQKTNAAADRSE